MPARAPAGTGTPAFAELPAIGEGSEERHAWDVWGRGDQLGSINRLTPERVAAAARLVRTGKVINLDLPLNEPDPAISDRTRYRHHVETGRQTRDDWLDGFYLQGSSQWDALGHVRYRQYGYWGGRQDGDVNEGREIGIDRWAEHGIVGRGVLIDAQRHFGCAPDERFPITGPMIEEAAEAQGVAIEPGDILLLHTGWLAWLLSLDRGTREGMRGAVRPDPGGLQAPGLDGAQPTAAWLWDRGVSAVAADNHALETLHVRREEGFQHRRLLPMLGIAVGEYFHLAPLAADCAADGVYECMLVSSPLNVPGGVGSPPNAYAIK